MYSRLPDVSFTIKEGSGLSHCQTGLRAPQISVLEGSHADLLNPLKHRLCTESVKKNEIYM